jgi:rhodanese-related sulfurtransferase
MARILERGEVQRLVGGGARLVEVLSSKAYEARHLPGALSIPLGRLGRAAAERLPRDRAVIVYCADRQ